MYLVSGESSPGSLGMVVDFERRPVPSALTVGPYSLGSDMTDKDIGSGFQSPDEWLKELESMNVDYVAIHRLGSNFAADYGSVFEDASELKDDTVFYFDRTNGLLTKCKYE